MLPRKTWVSENFGKISKSRKRFWLVSKSRFFMVCFYFLESRKFSTKGLGLGFLTRISASRRVPDFTIRHPSECIQDRPINAKRAAGFNNLLLFKLKLA